jgi:hypothetical protein
MILEVGFALAEFELDGLGGGIGEGAIVDG